MAYKAASDGNVRELQRLIGEWRRRQGFDTGWHNIPEKLMLTVTELSEAMEAFRHLKPEFIASLRERSLEDLPHPAIAPQLPDGLRTKQMTILDNLREELADTAIRLFDLADAIGCDLLDEICSKMGKNELRPRKHGKQC